MQVHVTHRRNNLHVCLCTKSELLVVCSAKWAVAVSDDGLYMAFCTISYDINLNTRALYEYMLSNAIGRRVKDQAVSHWPLTTDKWNDSCPVHVGFVVDEVAKGQGFPRILRFYSASIIPCRSSGRAV
jgi:hypothetical protein